MGTKSKALAHGQSDDGEAMIAEAAYFNAERRNFLPGYELSDWLAAEQEIESTLSSAKTVRTKSATQSGTKRKTKKKSKKVAAKIK